MLIFEENAVLGDVDELRACLDRFGRERLDLLMLHTYGNMLDHCTETAKDGRLIAKTPRGAIYALAWPLYSAKAYVIRPCFAKHLVNLLRSRIDNIHLDILLTMEAMHPSNTRRAFRGAVYSSSELYGNPIISVTGKTKQRIAHEEPIPNTYLLRGFMDRVLRFIGLV